MFPSVFKVLHTRRSQQMMVVLTDEHSYLRSNSYIRLSTKLCRMQTQRGKSKLTASWGLVGEQNPWMLHGEIIQGQTVSCTTGQC